MVQLYILVSYNTALPILNEKVGRDGKTIPLEGSVPVTLEGITSFAHRNYPISVYAPSSFDPESVGMSVLRSATELAFENGRPGAVLLTEPAYNAKAHMAIAMCRLLPVESVRKTK